MLAGAKRSIVARIALLASILTLGGLFVTRASAAVRPEGRLAPAQGALFGAYVDPDGAWSGNQAAQSDVQAFESQIGRKLDIDQHYYSWSNSFPSGLEEWDISAGRIPLVSWAGTSLDTI